MKRFALLCMLAGCFSDEAGLHIVVHDTHARAHSVDMYLVDKQAEGIDGMRPELATQSMQGRVLLLDTSAPPTNHVLHDGEVVFNVLPADAAEPLDLPSIIFIGRDENRGAVSFGEMDMLSLEAGGSVAYRFDLEEAAGSVAEPSDDNRPSGTRIFEWSHTKTDDRAECVDIEFAEDAVDGGVIHYFLVPPDDSDCDDVPAMANVCPVENDYVYDPDRTTTQATEPLLQNATCGHTTSLLGGNACALGAAPPPECSPAPSDDDCLEFPEPRFCTTNKICEQDTCLSQPDTCNADPGATNDWTRDGKGSTFLRCSLAFNANGGTCPTNQGSSVVFNFSDAFHAAFPQYLPSIGLGCNDANLWVPGGTPGRAVRFYQSATVRPKMMIVPELGSCTMTIGFEGDAVPNDDMTTDSVAYGGIDVTVGGTAPIGDHIVMPMRVDFIACMQHSYCEVVAGDNDFTSFQQCLPH